MGGRRTGSRGIARARAEEVRAVQRERFLEALCEGWPVTEACKQAGVGRRTVYEWRDADEAFKAAWEDAYEQGTDVLEHEARRRAVEGLPRFKFVSKTGEPLLHPVTREPYYELEYSDRLLETLLRARRPEKFRERYDVDGADGQVEIVVNLRRVEAKQDGGTQEQK